MIGRIIGNRYEILEQLGEGGMSLVYKARCTLLNRTVTIKILRPEFTGDQEFVNRFRREAQAVAKLSHPNIVSVYDVGEDNGIYYIVMEYVEGKTLKEVIREEGPLSPQRAVAIAEQICLALEHAHENGIVHRDIKPHNILISRDGRVKVTDFGIARAVSSATVTQAGTVLGSVHYFSPEQARGEVTGTYSDLYSLGVVMYEMVTGRVPFDGETPVAIALKHIQEQPVPPSALNPQVTPELEKVILRAMDKNLDRRYRSAREMLADLKTVLSGRIDERTRALPVPPPAEETRVLTPEEYLRMQEENQPKKKKMRRGAKIALILAGILFFVGLGIALNLLLAVPDVVVPDVRGMTLDQAERILEERGLRALVIDQQYSSEVPAGQVISQVPEPGRKVKKGRTVNLVLSKGVETVSVPDVRGKEVQYARFALEDRGFKVEITYEFSDTVPQDRVIDQAPEPGSWVEKGSTVTLTVSKGKEPKFVTVPDLVGRTLEEAKKLLEDLGLSLNDEIGRQSSDEYFKDRVISQEPAAGTQLQEGEAVKVTVSNGPGPEKKEARIWVKNPDSNFHTISIFVIDSRGKTEVYRKTFAPGEEDQVTVVYYGGNARYEVWQDDKPTDQKGTLP
ncbi:MAG: eukaryotic-like serine/threonine-protein kinase [Eubacteriales bacterium]|nr:eukaryotic-like serine/threonine-protein kinase [Eubacteriales bacterium]